MASVYERITEILIDVFDDDDLVATQEMTAADVAGWDSLAHVRFMLAIEREFGIKFTATEMGRYKSVGDLADAIAAKSA